MDFPSAAAFEGAGIKGLAIRDRVGLGVGVDIVAAAGDHLPPFPFFATASPPGEATSTDLDGGVSSGASYGGAARNTSRLQGYMHARYSRDSGWWTRWSFGEELEMGAQEEGEKVSLRGSRFAYRTP